MFLFVDEDEAPTKKDPAQKIENLKNWKYEK